MLVENANFCVCFNPGLAVVAKKRSFCLLLVSQTGHENSGTWYAERFSHILRALTTLS